MSRHVLQTARWVAMAGACAAIAWRLLPPSPPLAAMQTGSPPVAPADALATLRVEPGLRVELVAHEPALMSPVAMEVDEDGRIFIVEMPGYPLDSSPSGRIRVLEDTNGDRRIDRSTPRAWSSPRASCAGGAA
jgi:hypothetical protein